MERLSERELRNRSAEVLRAVAAGESFLVRTTGHRSPDSSRSTRRPSICPSPALHGDGVGSLRSRESGSRGRPQRISTICAEIGEVLPRQSAAAKLLVDEPESAALSTAIDGPDIELHATHLVQTELMRVAQRRGIDQSAVSGVLDRIWLHGMPPTLFREAGILPGAGLRSLDALHVAAALRLGVDAVLTDDARLADATRQVGLAAMSPAPL